MACYIGNGKSLLYSTRLDRRIEMKFETFMMITNAGIVSGVWITLVYLMATA